MWRGSGILEHDSFDGFGQAPGAAHGLVDAVVNLVPLHDVQDVGAGRVRTRVVELGQAAQEEHLALALEVLDPAHVLLHPVLAAELAEHDAHLGDHGPQVGHHAPGREAHPAEAIDPDARGHGLDVVEDGLLGKVDLVDVLAVDGRDEGGGQLVGDVAGDDVALGLDHVHGLAALFAVAGLQHDLFQDRGGLDDDPVLFSEQVEKLGGFRKQAEGHEPSLETGRAGRPVTNAIVRIY
jgi:hypothetical protein